MVCFGDYLKDYLEARDISQSEFATRMGVTQKHMNEILNGKTGITIEMAGNIERLTGISSSFIIAIENRRKIEENLLQKYGSKEELSKKIKEEYCVNELKKKEWKGFLTRNHARQDQYMNNFLGSKNDIIFFVEWRE